MRGCGPTQRSLWWVINKPLSRAEHMKLKIGMRTAESWRAYEVNLEEIDLEQSNRKVNAMSVN